MYGQQISEIVNRLVAEGMISKNKRVSAHVSIAALYRDKIAITWSVDDVLTPGIAPPKTTRKRAREILQEVLRKHDASIGINWDVLREAAR